MEHVSGKGSLTSVMTPWLWPVTAVLTIPGRSMSVKSGQSGDEILIAIESLLKALDCPLHV